MNRFAWILVAGFMAAAGCNDVKTTADAGKSVGSAPKAVAISTPSDSENDIPGNLAQLSAEDRALAEAQKLCVVSDEPLGSMGVPIKLDIKGKPVFICCKGCKKGAEKDPDKTLQKAAELKAKSGKDK